VRTRGWFTEFTTRQDVPQRVFPARGERLPVYVPTLKGADQLRRILEALARLEPTNAVRLEQFIEEMSVQIRRDATIVPVLGKVTPALASVLGNLVRQGYRVTAIIVDEPAARPDWTQPPDWAALLLAQEVDFRAVSSEEGIPDLCLEALRR
jgi:hypothetical protein